MKKQKGYVAVYKFDDTCNYVHAIHFEDIKDGFWIDKDFQFTYKEFENSFRWIPPTQIVYIQRDEWDAEIIIRNE